MSAGQDVDLLIERAKKHNPNPVVLADESLYPIEKSPVGEIMYIYTGEVSIFQIVKSLNIDL